MELCEYMGCSRLSEFVCQCLNQTQNFCSEHINIHTNDYQHHQISKNLTKIEESNRTIISIQCQACLKRLRIIREQILKISNRNIKIIMDRSAESLFFFREMEELYCSTLDYFTSKDKIMKDNIKFGEFLIKYSEEPNLIYADLLKKETEILLGLNIEEKIEKTLLQYNQLEEAFQKVNNENTKLKKELLVVEAAIEVLGGEFIT